MCWICDAYGDPEYGNGLWYLNPRNHSRQMYKLRKPDERVKTYGEDPEAEGGRRLEEMMEMRFEDPKRFAQLVEETNANSGGGIIQTGQVLPLQDALIVADLAYPIASMMCMCRLRMRATEETNEHEYSCTGLGVGMLKWERWPERYKGGVNFMSPDEAKEWLTKWNKKGLVHLIMTFGGSYLGGICNCDYPDCSAIRRRLDYGFTEQCLKSHYVAVVDYDICNGCGVCVQRCQFGALKFEVTTTKANIDPFRCFGCGLCETGCPRGAISLVDRVSLPALREVW
jgi:NAD-dependent dihydropyrimidine dehydrogenase PreA subunit